MKAVGIGQCAWDHLALVETYPEPDTKAEVLELTAQGGGPVATALVALRRLGVEAAFLGVVGDDEEAARITYSLYQEGVDLDGVHAREGSRSQVAYINVERSTARRTIYWQRPTGAPLAPGELPEGFLEGADLLLLDGLMKDVSLHAAKRAREMGVPVLVDAGRVREGMLELCALADHVVGSEEFARGLGLDVGAGERAFLDAAGRFDAAFTITLGARGSMSAHGGRVISVPALKVNAVDTTGAGDVFHAGYAYGVGLSCEGLGGRAALPTLDSAMDALERL